MFRRPSARPRPGELWGKAWDPASTRNQRAGPPLAPAPFPGGLWLPGRLQGRAARPEGLTLREAAPSAQLRNAAEPKEEEAPAPSLLEGLSMLSPQGPETS